MPVPTTRDHDRELGSNLGFAHHRGRRPPLSRPESVGFAAILFWVVAKMIGIQYNIYFVMVNFERRGLEIARSGSRLISAVAINPSRQVGPGARHLIADRFLV
jgi:hypothetical protein